MIKSGIIVAIELKSLQMVVKLLVVSYLNALNKMNESCFAVVVLEGTKVVAKVATFTSC